MHINALQLPALLRTNLRKNGVITVEQLTEHSQADLLVMRGLAELSVERIESALRSRGLALSSRSRYPAAAARRPYIPLTSAAVQKYLSSQASEIAQESALYDRIRIH